MADQSVFISYRRSSSRHLARAIYMSLRDRGYDVFLDVSTIDAGDFDRIILSEMASRSHFILVIAKGALERCQNADDWVLREIDVAIRLNRNILQIVDEDADLSVEYSYLPDVLRNFLKDQEQLPLQHFYFEEGMAQLHEQLSRSEHQNILHRVPKDDITRAPRSPEDLRRNPAIAVSQVVQIIDEPFDWIQIAGGTVILGDSDNQEVYRGGKSFVVSSFKMAKYPITTDQYAHFIYANGYRDKRWWTEDGWRFVQNVDHILPVYARDAKFNKSMRPMPVTWYEAIAYCNWLSDRTGLPITLPTEQQWQWAAQGPDGRLFPWGNEWDTSLCAAKGRRIGRRSHVRSTQSILKYEGKGDSPFGVIDMVGNLSEWCLTEPTYGSHDRHQSAEKRARRGGSSNTSGTVNMQCDKRSYAAVTDSRGCIRLCYV